MKTIVFEKLIIEQFSILTCVTCCPGTENVGLKLAKFPADGVKPPKLVP